MFMFGKDHFLCTKCSKPITFPHGLPLDVIREQFTVLDLHRAIDVMDDGRVLYEHPLVCGDACHGRAMREGIEGYETVQGVVSPDDLFIASAGTP